MIFIPFQSKQSFKFNLQKYTVTKLQNEMDNFDRVYNYLTSLINITEKLILILKAVKSLMDAIKS